MNSRNKKITCSMSLSVYYSDTFLSPSPRAREALCPFNTFQKFTVECALYEDLLVALMHPEAHRCFAVIYTCIQALNQSIWSVSCLNAMQNENGSDLRVFCPSVAFTCPWKKRFSKSQAQTPWSTWRERKRWSSGPVWQNKQNYVLSCLCWPQLRQMFSPEKYSRHL